MSLVCGCLEWLLTYTHTHPSRWTWNLCLDFVHWWGFLPSHASASLPLSGMCSWIARGRMYGWRFSYAHIPNCSPSGNTERQCHTSHARLLHDATNWLTHSMAWITRCSAFTVCSLFSFDHTLNLICSTQTTEQSHSHTSKGDTRHQETEHRNKGWQIFKGKLKNYFYFPGLKAE